MTAFNPETHTFGMAYRYTNAKTGYDIDVIYPKVGETVAYPSALHRYPEADLIPLADALALVEALEKCLPRIEEIRLVDLGAVRDAENNGYRDNIVRARRELAETDELINTINAALAAFRAKHGGGK